MKAVFRFGNLLLSQLEGIRLPSVPLDRWPRLILDKVFSLKYLLAIGFVVTMIPVGIALSYADFGMRETASLGEEALFQTAEQMKVMRAALQQVNDIERKAKLFVLLSDPSLRQPYERESYENVRTSFRQTMNELLQQSADNRLSLLINELLEKERLIHDQVTSFDDGDDPKLPVEEAFRGLRDAANGLWQEVTGRVSRQAEGLHQKAQALEQRMLIRTVALMSFSVGFFLLLMIVLQRAIGRLDQAIRKLGAGLLTEPIAVNGPEDLRHLGDRLEWLRTRLLNLEQAKHQFMHNVTREIEAPLAAIHDDTARFVRQAGKGEAGEVGMRLQQNAEKLQTVCEELLRYSRINENPSAAERTSADLKQLLDQVLAGYREPIQAKALRVKALSQRIEFKGINEQITGIFEHLVGNAVKFSPEGGEIRIMLRSSGDAILFEVEDDGPGIDADEREEVLKPFSRGRAAMQLGTEGAGLGLAIVSEYLVHCQGRIEIVEPRQDRHGARVRVQIPIINVE